MKKLVSIVMALVISLGALLIAQEPASAAQVTAEVVNVDFTTALGGTITNTATGRIADLQTIGSPTFSGTDGATFNNGQSVTPDYLKGNLGTTTDMSKITVEFNAKFPDTGCEGHNSGSMVFALGTNSGSLAYYNIYRHSNFIGFNTFNSDLYGISLPDTTSYHNYKFVMLPSATNGTSAQEIWVDGVKQTTAFKTTSSPVGPCSVISGTAETASERKFVRSPYSNGDFMFMTHPLGATTWGTTGSVKSLKITTVITNATVVAPDAPTIDAISQLDGQLIVAFTAPSYNGGAPITDYKYSINNGSTWVSTGGPTSSIIINGLTNGTTYNVKVRAVNSAGDGTASSAVAATPFTVPAAPTIGTITAGNAQLSVPFTAPSSTGGSTITDYKYSTDNGTTWTSAVSRVSPIVITGLTNGTAYNVKLRAVNAAGDGTASTAVSATPAQPQSQGSSSGSGSAPAPATPPAKVESITVTKGPTGGSLLKVKIENQEGLDSKSSVKVRLLNLRGELIQELTVAVTPATSVIQVPVKLNLGEFTVEAVALNAAGVSQTVASEPTYVAKPHFTVVPGSVSPILEGKKIASPIFFNPDSAALSAEAKKSLLEFLARVTKPNTRIAITGFTASRNQGTSAEKKLAAARALQVARFLKANSSNVWIYYAGYGALKNGQSFATARKVELRILN
jgi:outer membrane protein OmpA-like peptidoglycan-associated protein